VPWRKIVLGTLFTFASVLCVGYAMAWVSLTWCADETYRTVSMRNIREHDFPVLDRDDVSARVVGPFLVEVSYLVRQELHGSVHYVRYWAFPWGRSEPSPEVVDLVEHG
jgi:hypothetical protein